MSIPYNLLNVNKYHTETFSNNNNNVEVNENTFIAKGRTLMKMPTSRMYAQLQLKQKRICLSLPSFKI